MPDAEIIEGIESKFNALVGDLDERGCRRWAAAEAIALGRGGIATVTIATGLSDRTIRNGIKELQSGAPLSSGRQRRSGGGRKCPPPVICTRVSERIGVKQPGCVLKTQA